MRAPARDLRMVPLAVAGWLAAALGTEGTAYARLAVVLAVAAALCYAGVRRSAGAVGVAVVLAALGAVGGLHGHRLTAGPVADLARDGAVVEAELEIRADPHLAAGSGGRPGYAVSRAALRQVSAGGRAWRVRTPVRVLVGAAAAADWARLPVGTRVSVTAVLRAPDRGDDVAAVLRVRGQPEPVAGPAPAERLVERVRAGLRTSVAARAAEPRALVPALVMGDTSGLTEELEEEFAATGLAHLTVR